jgi:Cu2+-exporting ATPase
LVNPRAPCDLCGLEIGNAPVTQTFDGDEKRFCCRGCARVYQVAHENGLLDQVLARPQAKSPGFAELVFQPGETAYFALGEMWCAGCAVAAERALHSQPGVKAAEVSFAAERGRVQYDPAQIEPAALMKKLTALGYQAHLLTDRGERQVERRQERTLLQLVTAAGFGMQVMVLYLAQLYPAYAAGQWGTPDVRRMQYLVWLLATPVLLVGGSSFLRGALRALRARTATMDTLVALATLSAYGYSVYVAMTGTGEAYFDSVAMITTFVMLGRYLETLGGTQARKDIRHLLTLQPDRAWRQTDGAWQQVAARTLAPGDTILVKPGERVPADAVILEGAGAADEALLTGESVPVEKGPGDAILAGTVVADAALVARVTRPVGDTRLAHITQLVERTLAAKPPIQRMADRAAAYFALGILTVAALTCLAWWLTGHPLSRALLAAVAVLVVACPCALGLATPLALTVTLGRATQAGILVRNPAALETAAQIQRIAFDKTGTLTQGRMAVATTVVVPSHDTAPAELLCLAAAVEAYSEHPVAQAIGAACTAPPAPAYEFQALRGLGASARVMVPAERRVMVGSARFLGLDGQHPLAAQAQAHAERGETVVWVGWDSVVAGFIVLRDEINPTAQAALGQLQAAGIRPVMLSGDNPQTSAAVAAALGLTEYEGHCPPPDKAARIRAWQASGERVAMAGDGVNDAPALAQAHLSITVAGGTDVAGETSDVVLTRPDLTLIPWFIGLSRRTRQVILENLGWAFAYNLISIPLAVMGIISPVIAAATMASSSLLVVGNSLRLRS